MTEAVYGPARLDVESVDGWLARHAIDGDDAAAMKTNVERLLVYRDLVGEFADVRSVRRIRGAE